MMTYKSDRAEQTRDAMHALAELGSTTHLLTLAVVAVLDQRNALGEPGDVVNPHRVNQCIYYQVGIDRTVGSTRTAMQRLADEGLVEKRDLEPDSQRLRYDWRLSQAGWRLLRITGLMTLVHHLATLFSE